MCVVQFSWFHHQYMDYFVTECKFLYHLRRMLNSVTQSLHNMDDTLMCVCDMMSSEILMLTLLSVSTPVTLNKNPFTLRNSDILNLPYLILSHAHSVEPGSVGDVLSAPFDLRWLHRQGLMKALWAAGLLCAAVVWVKMPSDRCCRLCLSALKQLGLVISAHWRWHHLTSVHLTHLPLFGSISGPWHMLHFEGGHTGKEGWAEQGLGP